MSTTKPKGGDSRRMVKTKTPGVYKRGGKYVTTWRRNGRQHRETFDSYAEAREAKHGAHGGKRRAPDRTTVAEYADRWIGAYRGRTTRGFSETTRIEYRRDIEQSIKPYFRTMRLDAIDGGEVAEWMSWLEKQGRTPRAIKKAKAVLSAMLGDAAERDRKIAYNPARGVPYVPVTPVPPKPRPRDLTAHDLDRFLAAVVEVAAEDREAGRSVHPWRAMLFPFLGATGLRISEALGVNWRDLDLFAEDGVTISERPTVEVNDQVYEGERKGLKSASAYRTVPLSPAIAFALTRLQAETPFSGPGDPVFASSTGTPMRANNIQTRIVKPAKERSGVEWPAGRCFHAFRHFLGSHVHEAGRSNRQLADWLGHADPAFTLRTYVGQTGEGLGDAAFIDELVRVPSADRGGG